FRSGHAETPELVCAAEEVRLVDGTADTGDDAAIGVLPQGHARPGERDRRRGCGVARKPQRVLRQAWVGGQAVRDEEPAPGVEHGRDAALGLDAAQELDGPFEQIAVAGLEVKRDEVARLEPAESAQGCEEGSGLAAGIAVARLAKVVGAA